MTTAIDFKPQILGFVCHWWGYGAADLAGVSRLQYTTETKLIRVMCTGRVDMEMVLTAFARGADGVFIGGCRLNECNYVTGGNYDALNMALLCRRILEHYGINPERLSIQFMSSGDGILFADIMNVFGKKINELGPLGKGEGLSVSELKANLNAVIKLIPYIKLMKNDKLATRLKDPAEYDALFSRKEIDELLSQAVAYYIDPALCQACTICARKCPVEAISGGRNIIHIIDQAKCIKCGICFKSCPPRFRAIKELVSEPVPSPISEEARIIKVRPRNS